jgi:hypothetical protein
MLTREEAQQLILSRLKARQDGGDFVIAQERTIEREFGWLFVLTLTRSGSNQRSEIVRDRLIIVNKSVGQLIGSSIDYSPERFVEVYETLLVRKSQTGANWCLTVSGPPIWNGFLMWRLAKKAKQMGLYEIR